MIRVIIVIDLPNLRAQFRVLNQKPDLLRLRDFLQNLGKGRYEIDTVVFDWFTHERAGRYHKFLQHHGFRVITKEAKRMFGGSFTSTLEMEITIEAINVYMENKLDVFVLVSGNRNLANLCQFLRKKGVRIEVVSLLSFLAKELKFSAHKIIDLIELAAPNGFKGGEPTGQDHITESEKSMAEIKGKNETPEKGQHEPKENDLENNEKKYPGFNKSLIGTGLEAEPLYSVVKKEGLSAEWEKLQKAVLDRFGDGKDFRHIKKEDLEDKSLYILTDGQEPRKFIGDLLRKMVLRRFGIDQKKRGQHLAGCSLYKFYLKIRQAKDP